MKLERPIVFFDVETTGLSLSEDRIIEISMVKLSPNGSKEKYYNKLNPEGRPIHPDAFEKHGIKYDELLECPRFVDIAQEIYNFIENCDFGGYNCKRFDIPILIEEFLRARIPINIKKFKIVDVYMILTKAEPRTLSGTYKRFFGKDLEGAHGAEADIFATIEILEKLENIFDIPETVEEIHEYAFNDGESFDLEGRLKLTVDRKIAFTFGKYKNQLVSEVFKRDPGYFDWIINKSDMTQYTKSIFRNIVNSLI